MVNLPLLRRRRVGFRRDIYDVQGNSPLLVANFAVTVPDEYAVQDIRPLLVANFTGDPPSGS